MFTSHFFKTLLVKKKLLKTFCYVFPGRKKNMKKKKNKKNYGLNDYNQVCVYKATRKKINPP